MLSSWKSNTVQTNYPDTCRYSSTVGTQPCLPITCRGRSGGSHLHRRSPGPHYGAGVLGITLQGTSRGWRLGRLAKGVTKRHARFLSILSAKAASCSILFTRSFMTAMPKTTFLNPNDNSTCGVPGYDSWQILRAPMGSDMPWPGFLFGQTPASIWYWCADQVRSWPGDAPHRPSKV